MDVEQHMFRIASRMRRVALQLPWNGQSLTIVRRCIRRDIRTGASLMFTYDYGYHTGGWWKNPDYERCLHLSISSLAAILDVADVPELTEDLRRRWAEAFFPDTTRLLWIEPPYTRLGETIYVWHYRLFTDEGGVPILPRGEVYSKELTEAGWKSFSEIHSMK